MKENYNKTKGYRIRLARKTRGLTQVQLAKEIKTTQQTIHDYEKNKRGSYADTNLLVSIAHICQVTIDWILTGETALDSLSNIPILTSPKALLTWLKQNKSDFYKRDKRVGFFLVDNSMASRTINNNANFKSKDIIIISGNKPVAPNNYVIATTPIKTSPILFRQLLLKKNKYLLKPLNKNYPIIPVEGSIKIVGTAVEQRRLFQA